MAPRYRRPPTLVGAAGLYGDWPLLAFNRAGSRAAVRLPTVDEHNAAAASSIYGSAEFNSQNTVFERPRRASLKAEVSMRSGKLIRSDIKSGAWQASPLRIAMARPRALNLGQLIRSIVL